MIVSTPEILLSTPELSFNAELNAKDSLALDWDLWGVLPVTSLNRVTSHICVKARFI